MSAATSYTFSLSDRLQQALVALTPESPGAIEALRPLYDPAMVFRDPIQEVRGIDKFLALNHRLVGKMKKLDWEMVSARGDDDQVFLEWTMRGTPKLGPKICVSGVTRARATNGLIVDHRDYWDLGEMFASSLPGGQKILHGLLKPLA